MPQAPLDPPLPESSSLPRSCSSPKESPPDSHLSHLRSVRWRIDLGILPSSPTSSIDDLRRVAADSRRRYAGFRRRLLIDPHVSKEVDQAPDLVMENPLSQNPDSMWGRFFRNAELEKMVDQDLSRLYPEHGSYFQTPACQAMLRRILLLWCLRHPEYGYRQGMHELLAPLLYVLQVDVQHISKVRGLYEDHFADKFDGISFEESNAACNYNFIVASSPVSVKWGTENDDRNDFQESITEGGSLDELDPYMRTIVLLTDSYGAEGELGILLSERFMEHDAYCMFDALMSGDGGGVSMADHFSPSPAVGSLTGLPPVIEASSAMYNLLSVVDSSLHSHLVELGVEPQYFALRWFRVLFGREFLLEDLLVIWDEIFASPNEKSHPVVEDDMQPSFKVLSSPRGAFIAAIAVSMLLHVRSSLLASENATSCLQRLLNFPENVNVKKLIEMARSFQALALDTVISPAPSMGGSGRSKSAIIRGHSLTTPGSFSPRTTLNLLPDSYWEEKWRVLHKEQEHKQGSPGDRISGVDERERLSLARTESAPSSTKPAEDKKDTQITLRRKLLGEFEKLGSKEGSSPNDPLMVKKSFVEAQSTEEICLGGPAAGEENSSILSTYTSPHSRPNDTENDSEKSSVASCISTDDNEDETNNREEPSCNISDSRPLAVSEPTNTNSDVIRKQTMFPKERKLLSGKFHWLWKSVRSTGEGTSEKGGSAESVSQISADVGNNHKGLSGLSDDTDKNVVGTLRNLGQSMLQNIQVIESGFQQDRGQADSLENLSRNNSGGKGQVAAIAALKELRKISNLLSEMR
ncbi:hypothetical protein AAC387_Pa03g0032 [Persea americana]